MPTPAEAKSRAWHELPCRRTACQQPAGRRCVNGKTRVPPHLERMADFALVLAAEADELQQGIDRRDQVISADQAALRAITTERDGLKGQVDGLKAANDQLDATLAASDQQLAQLSAQNTDLSRRVTDAADDLAAAQATILDQKNQIAALTPKPAGPLVGAHYATSSVAARGIVDMPIQRTYHSGMPATFAQHEAHEDVGKRVSWLSIKPDVAKTASGELDSVITGFAKSINPGHPCMITDQHEPENPSKNIDPALFVKAQVRFYNLVKAVRPDILVGPIFMQGLFGSYPAPRDWANWGLPKGSLDFLGVDSYNPYMMPVFGTPKKWGGAFPTTPVLAAQRIADSLGVPMALGEFGSLEFPDDPAQKIAYAQQVLDFATAHGWLAVCYFDSVKAGDTAPGIVLDSSPEFKAFWNAAVTASPRVLRAR